MTKTLSFGAMHMTVAFVVVWAMTGDWMTGGVVALVEPCVNTVAYHFHEKGLEASAQSRGCTDRPADARALRGCAAQAAVVVGSARPGR